MNQGANLKAKTRIGGFNAVHIAAQSGQKSIIEFLLKAGADVDGTTNTGATALIIAAECGHTEIVALLLAHGADTKRKSKEGMTALSYAVTKKRSAIIELLRHHESGGAYGTNTDMEFHPIPNADGSGMPPRAVSTK